MKRSRPKSTAGCSRPTSTRTMVYRCSSPSWISRSRWSVWRNSARQSARCADLALLRHLVLHEAQHHPCILTVENLHWSDATSEEWLTAGRATGETPLRLS